MSLRSLARSVPLSRARRAVRRVVFGAAPNLHTTRLDSVDAFLRHRSHSHDEASSQRALERSLIDGSSTFTVPGFCFACARPSQFVVDYRYCSETETGRTPNWRESLICPCGLNNRLRASLQIFESLCRPSARHRIYISEQTTPMYRWLARHYTSVVGSEYLGERVPFGSVDPSGIRNESVTRLTFPDAAFDHILSFDVLEHVPDVDKALRECRRCLEPGGYLVLSVPFVADSPSTIVRARVLENGSIDHLLPPEYHGDPLTTDGCLCFYHFGWDLLDRLRIAGFREASVIHYWSRELAYLGADQLLILARR